MGALNALRHSTAMHTQPGVLQVRAARCTVPEITRVQRAVSCHQFVSKLVQQKERPEMPVTRCVPAWAAHVYIYI